MATTVVLHAPFKLASEPDKVGDTTQLLKGLSSQFTRHQCKNSGYGRCVMWNQPLILVVIYLTIFLSIGWLFSIGILYWL